MTDSSLTPTNLGGLHGVGEEAVIGEQIIKDAEAATEKLAGPLTEKKTKADKDATKEDKPGLGNFFVSLNGLGWL